MNSNKPGPRPESRPDDLIRSNTVELNEEELGSVNGGIKIGTKTESLIEQKHKDELPIESLQPRLWTHK
jgi:hypothetical protein